MWKHSNCTCIDLLAVELVSKPKVRYLWMAALWWFYFVIGSFSCWTEVLSDEFNRDRGWMQEVMSLAKMSPRKILHPPKLYGLSSSLSCTSLGYSNPVIQVLNILVACLQFLGTSLNLKSDVRLWWARAEFCTCSAPSFITKKKDEHRTWVDVLLTCIQCFPGEKVPAWAQLILNFPW